jgi:short subunit dehydrogenase-like uncharacterized protein
MKIVVIGAYGYTGRLICDELEAAGLSFSVCGRKQEQLVELTAIYSAIEEVFVGDILNSEFGTNICKIHDYIVNCAGPFTQESAAFMAIVAQSGKTYLDISGEVGFLKKSNEDYQEVALQHNSLIIHSCAFESLISDLAIQHLIEKETKLVGIRTYYWFNQKRVSPGTKMTMKMSNISESLKIEHGVWAFSDLEKDKVKIEWEFDSSHQVGISYPLPEIAFANWSHQVDFASSYLILPANEAVVSGMARKSDKSPEEILEQLKKIKKKGPTEEERKLQNSRIVVEITKDDQTVKRLLIINSDMYRTTAKAIVLEIMRIEILSNRPVGYTTPASIFIGIEKETLSKLNCTITEPKLFEVS